MDSDLYITMDPKSYTMEKEMWAQKFAKDPKLSEKFTESVEAISSALKCVSKNFPGATGYQMTLDLLTTAMIGLPKPGTRTTFRMLHSALVQAQDILEKAENDDSVAMTGEQTSNIPQTRDGAAELMNSVFLSTCEQVINQVVSRSMSGKAYVEGNGLEGNGDEDNGLEGKGGEDKGI